VHAFVAGLQDFPPHADSSATVHCTQVPAEQTPLPAMCLQSSFVTHFAHALSSPQRDAFASVQSGVAKHWTHFFAVGSHCPVGAVQSSLVKHSTHAFAVVSH
jgi:hypothetical protein